MIFTPLKLLSALIIVGACFFCGAPSVAEAENTSYRQLSGILALLAHIRTRITYTHFSLEVIFADFYDVRWKKRLSRCTKTHGAAIRLPSARRWDV